MFSDYGFQFKWVKVFDNELNKVGYYDVPVNDNDSGVEYEAPKY